MEKQVMSEEQNKNVMHGTTILCVRHKGQVVIAADGQVSFGNSIMKSNARKLRTLASGSIVAGFAGATADAFTLFERLEEKLEKHPESTSSCLCRISKRLEN
jgi:ATP-dependent HslUV protease subunit HslV